MPGRIRTIKPEILENRRTASLQSDEFRLFIACIVMADDHGNLVAEPAKIYGSVFWACEPREPVKKLLETLASVSLLDLYEVDGNKFAHIVGWCEHQKIDRPSKPKVPGKELSNNANLVNTRETLDEHSRDTRETLDSEGKGIEGKGRDARRENFVSQADLESIYDLYPRHEGKTQGMKKAKREIKTLGDLSSLRSAVENYSAKIQSEGIEKKYIKQFSTFMGCWKDYLQIEITAQSTNQLRYPAFISEEAE